MGQYPWGFTGVTPNASDNLADKGSFDGQQPGLHRRRRAARRAGAPLRRAGRHGAEARLGRDRRPVLGPAAGPPLHRHRAGRAGRSQALRVRRRTVRQGHRRPADLFGVPAGRRLEDRVAGASPAPTTGLRGRRSRSWPTLLEDPSARSPRRSPPASSSRGMTQLSLPGDPLVQNAVEWGKQNIADLTQQAEDLQIRWTNQGKQFPAPSGTVPQGDLDRRRLSRTTRGSSAPTPSTPRSLRSRSASSRRSRTTCAPCATSPTS